MSAGDDHLADLTLVEVAHLLETRQISPVDLAHATLMRAERLQSTHNPFIRLEGEAFLRAARAADVEIGRGEYRGPLHGIPLTLKDLIDVAGLPTTAGSAILRDAPPATTHATVWARLEAAGALLLGKTNLHEFAFGATTVNPHFGSTLNAWDRERVAGGSSGGCAVAVASGASYGSLGTDTGGSIRCPAALNGVTGLKPTYGRVSRAGVFPLCWSQDHVGPLARTAQDCAILLDAIAGADPRDPTTERVPETRIAESLAQAPTSLRGLRVGLLVSHRAAVLDSSVGAAVDTAVEVLRALGAETSDVDLPEEAEAMDAGRLVLLTEAAALHLPWLRDRGEDYGIDVRRSLQPGALLAGVDYVDGQRTLRRLIPRILERLAEVDVVVGPVTPIGAPHPDRTSMNVGGRELEIRPVLLRMTRVFDLTGQPAVTVPCGFTADGLPVGMHLIGQPWAEETVLRVAHAFQQVTDWHRHRPPVN